MLLDKLHVPSCELNIIVAPDYGSTSINDQLVDLQPVEFKVLFFVAEGSNPVLPELSSPSFAAARSTDFATASSKVRLALAALSQRVSGRGG